MGDGPTQRQAPPAPAQVERPGRLRLLSRLLVEHLQRDRARDERLERIEAALGRLDAALAPVLPKLIAGLDGLENVSRSHAAVMDAVGEARRDVENLGTDLSRILEREARVTRRAMAKGSEAVVRRLERQVEGLLMIWGGKIVDGVNGIAPNLLPAIQRMDARLEAAFPLLHRAVGRTAELLTLARELEGQTRSIRRDVSRILEKMLGLSKIQELPADTVVALDESEAEKKKDAAALLIKLAQAAHQEVAQQQHNVEAAELELYKALDAQAEQKYDEAIQHAQQALMLLWTSVPKTAAPSPAPEAPALVESLAHAPEPAAESAAPAGSPLPAPADTSPSAEPVPAAAPTPTPAPAVAPASAESGIEIELEEPASSAEPSEPIPLINRKPATSQPASGPAPIPAPVPARERVLTPRGIPVLAPGTLPTPIPATSPPTLSPTARPGARGLDELLDRRVGGGEHRPDPKDDGIEPADLPDPKPKK